MSTELLASLDKKVRQLITDHATLQLEIAQLKEENARLLAQQHDWEQQLTGLLQRFDANDPTL